MAAADAERTDTDEARTGAEQATGTAAGDDSSSGAIAGNIERVADKVKGLLRFDQ